MHYLIFYSIFLMFIFFLRHNYLNDLPSLDPELYRHLIFLKVIFLHLSLIFYVVACPKRLLHLLYKIKEVKKRMCIASSVALPKLALSRRLALHMQVMHMIGDICLIVCVFALVCCVCVCIFFVLLQLSITKLCLIQLKYFSCHHVLVTLYPHPLVSIRASQMIINSCRFVLVFSYPCPLSTSMLFE